MFCIWLCAVNLYWGYCWGFKVLASNGASLSSCIWAAVAFGRRALGFVWCLESWQARLPLNAEVFLTSVSVLAFSFWSLENRMSESSLCIKERIEQLSLVLWARPESQRHQLNGCSKSKALILPDHDAFPVKPQPMGKGEVDVYS